MIVSIIGNFSSAETPLVGSSSSSSLGRAVSAMAMSSSLRTPPGSSAHAAVAVLGEAEALEQRLGALDRVGAGARGCQKLRRAVVAGVGDEHVVEHRQVAAELRDLERARHAESGDRARRERGDVAAVERMWPASGLR